ncbi:Zinc finger and BTB domain-containing protein 17 [Pseudolycoriella hygida]|uniref:Zinc finger and BTB domain-containing protein 17 n=1 Tax=Pseudolycoriella hygida TaxID=35572 RepID=A0A9Q0RSP9_9DIPT|nr:Zinc finger and BTB domain-containing protein 17 [Pseudolycoriella hygida]
MAAKLESDSSLKLQLKTKKICRFCCSTSDSLSNIYSTENRIKSKAPLPLQIISCISIEVFTNDGMPSLICDACRLLMDFCYRFKQMCKNADTSLKQFPLTGLWPEKLDLPQYPEELLKARVKFAVPQPIKRELHSENIFESPPKRARNTSPTKSAPPTTQPKPAIKFLNRSSQPSVPTNSKHIVVIKGESGSEEIEVIETIAPTPPKILNKNAKILNQNATTTSDFDEPKLGEPIIRTDDQGNFEIVTVILENDQDPLKVADPVETNVFPCSYCERSFPLKQLLDIHVTNHTRERKFSCDVCQKLFFSKYDLSKHALIHSGEKPFKCVVCSKSFSRSTLLSRHEKIHVEQPKHVCSYCDRKYLNAEDLERHIENHKKNRPFPCGVCGKSFAFKQGLERHEVIHQKDQPYQCEHCDQSFSTPNKLARHLTAHAGQRPFPCRLCPKSYLLSHHLSRHLRSHKDSEGSYKCSDCDKMFTVRDDLIYHSAIHATQNLTCPLCKSKFKTLDEVTDHIKSHTLSEQYACEFCDLIFTTEDQLVAHSQLDHSDEQAAYDEDNKSRIIKVTESDYNDPLFGDPVEPKFSVSSTEIQEISTEEDENNSSHVEDFAVKTYTKHKVIKGNNSDSQQRLTRSADLKKGETCPPRKLPVLTKVNVQNVPKGITITKTKKVLPKPIVTSEKKPEIETASKTPSPSSSSESKSGEIQKFKKLNNEKELVSTTGSSESAKSPPLQKVKLTKAQVASMAKEGKITVKDGQVFLRNTPNRNVK